MTTPTVEQLREAAAHLTELRGIDNPAWACRRVAWAGELFAEGDIWREDLLDLSRRDYWYNCEAQARHAAESARWRLLIEALWQEQQARRVLVGANADDCLRADGCCAGCVAPQGTLHRGTCDWETCGKCGDQRMACGCEEEEMMALVGQLTAPADAPAG